MGHEGRHFDSTVADRAADVGPDVQADHGEGPRGRGIYLGGPGGPYDVGAVPWVDDLVGLCLRCIHFRPGIPAVCAHLRISVLPSEWCGAIVPAQAHVSAIAVPRATDAEIKAAYSRKE